MSHGVELVVATMEAPRLETQAPPLETPTMEKTWTPCSPPSPKTQSKETEVGEKTGATQTVHP